MPDSHTHHHHHHHHHPTSNYTRAFIIGTVVNVVFVIIEFGFGFWTGSLSFLADAGHNLSDVFGLLVAWVGNFLAQHPPTQRYTYGLRRSSILAVGHGIKRCSAVLGVSPMSDCAKKPIARL